MAAEGDKQPDAHQHTLRISSRFGRRTLVDLLEADTGVSRDCLPAAIDDRVGWRKTAIVGGGGRG